MTRVRKDKKCGVFIWKGGVEVRIILLELHSRVKYGKQKIINEIEAIIRYNTYGVKIS